MGKLIMRAEHKIMCGSSTDAESVTELMAGELADLLLTDPPYNIDYTGKTKDNLTIKNDDMDDESFKEFLVESFSSADHVMRPGAIFYIWHADTKSKDFHGAVINTWMDIRQCLVWVKQHFTFGRQDYQWRHECCIYGWKPGASHNWYSDRKQTTVLEFDRPTKNDLHPTMKPTDLMEYQIKNSTKKGQLVLDLFIGSGSTMIASENTDRRCYGMELDPKYVDVCVERWQKFTGRSATLAETGQTFKSVNEERLA